MGRIGTVSRKRSSKRGESPRDPPTRRDRERSDPQSERASRSRLLEILRKSEVPEGLPGTSGLMASTEASADQRKGEDIVHASRRRGDQREQGSRTGRCGWITSFLGIHTIGSFGISIHCVHPRSMRRTSKLDVFALPTEVVRKTLITR